MTSLSRRDLLKSAAVGSMAMGWKFPTDPYAGFKMGMQTYSLRAFDTCTGDTNGDGFIDTFDIQPFIDCLFSTGNGNSNGGNGNANGGNGNTNSGNGNANGANGNANGP